MRETLEAHLDAFATLRRPGSPDYAWSTTHEGGEHGTQLVVGCMVHGDEVGSLPAMVRILSELAEGSRRFGGRLTVFLGNPEAGLDNVRFLEDDLNRVFVEDPPDTHEGRRARAIKPILDSADVFVDLHQTILATAQPFYIFPFQLDGWRWARCMQGASVWVTRHPGQAFSSGTMCADEYVRRRGRPGITLELSEKGFGHGGEVRAYEAIGALLRTADAVASKQQSLEGAAERHPELGFLHTTHRESFASDALALRPGLVNFQTVKEGELLSADGTPAITAPHAGHVLFPKYPPQLADGSYKQPLPGEIYRIVSPLPEHPARMWGDLPEAAGKL